MSYPLSVTITPRATASVTATEILEDFADATDSWTFLEEDTDHFVTERASPACIVRHRSLTGLSETDFIFRATDAAHPEALRLTLMVTAQDDTSLPGTMHRHLLAHFLDDFASYLRRHNTPVVVDVHEAASEGAAYA